MCRVLVVDDDDEILDLLVMTLRRPGYDVCGFADPLAALEFASSTGFDVALLDWSMPKMNGGELCARLRQVPDLRETPIVIVTAHADPATRDQAAEAGATAFLTKPFSLKHVTEVVAELVAPGS